MIEVLTIICFGAAVLLFSALNSVIHERDQLYLRALIAERKLEYLEVKKWEFIHQ